MIHRVGALLGTILGTVHGDVPVDPDGGEAKRWILEELSKPEYQAAKPTWWDLLSQAFLDWFSNLDLSGAGIFQGPLLAILLLVIVAVIIVGILIFGVPRRNRHGFVPGALFGADEQRTSEQLREAARAAAAAGDFSLAVEELFRSLARVLTERVVVSTHPGTTATGFAAKAGAVFPHAAEELAAHARVFDRVRYLAGRASEPEYVALAELERELRTARPGPTIPPGPGTIPASEINADSLSGTASETSGPAR